MAKQSRVAEKPKLGFDWARLDAELRDATPAGWRSRDDVPGGFTTREFADKYGISQAAAAQRIQRLLRGGVLRKVARAMTTKVFPDGARKSTQEWVYDTVKQL